MKDYFNPFYWLIIVWGLYLLGLGIKCFIGLF